jgi:hypothetical protein
MNIKYISLFLCLSLSSCSFSNKKIRPNQESVKTETQPPKISKRKTVIAPNKLGCINPNFIKQVTLGYQGWFSAKGDGVSNTWKHWSPYNTVPAPGNITFEMYPDVSEYNASDLFPTKLGKLGNGKPAKLFSSARDGVVNLHFKWMKDYQLDGIALQRFASELKHKKNLKHNNKVAQLVKKYAEKYCRTFYITYDISSSPIKDIVSRIKNDWTTVMEKKLNLIDSQQYARYKGKPVTGLWGFGLNTPAHNFSQKQALDLIKWFRKKGFYVVGGVPYNWRLGKLDSRKNWLSVYKQYDMVLPWSVGRYRETKELLHHYESIWQQDLVFSKKNNLQMKRVIFPGFAWSNWQESPRNVIPRKKGDLFWKQAYLTNRLGLGAYIAMFDEYDEGTAIAKTAKNRSMRPGNQYFLTLSEDGHQLSSDYYLRLSEKITQMIHGTEKFNFTIPRLISE